MGNRKKNPETFRRIEEFINKYYEENGTSPSNAEIVQGIGVSSATVSRYLNQMKKDGVIRFDGIRTIQTKKMQKLRIASIHVPIYDQRSCTASCIGDHDSQDYLFLPETLVPPGDYFLLKIMGDSMYLSGIDDSDYVLVRRQNTAEPGQVVVAAIDNTLTVKRYYPEPARNQIRLHPDMREMVDMFVPSCDVSVLGVVVNTIKSIPDPKPHTSFLY